MQFCIMASECWFLCNGIDLYYSITNPFSSSISREKKYHLFSWVFALLVSLIPFALDNGHSVYGFWYVDYNIKTANICWLKTDDHKLGVPFWLLFIFPLAIIFSVCLASLVYAYQQLRRGLTKSFLPRMRLLVTNTINVFIVVIHWGWFGIFYTLAFWTKDSRPHTDVLVDIVYFTLSSKGMSSLLIYIFVSDTNLNSLGQSTEESVDANVALREEVLNFATAGIRSVARSSASIPPDKVEVTRQPKQVRILDSRHLITPAFYLRFMLGQVEQISAVQKMMAGRRRSVNNNNTNLEVAKNILLNDNDRSESTMEKSFASLAKSDGSHQFPRSSSFRPTTTTELHDMNTKPKLHRQTSVNDGDDKQRLTTGSLRASDMIDVAEDVLQVSQKRK